MPRPRPAAPRTAAPPASAPPRSHNTAAAPPPPPSLAVTLRLLSSFYTAIQPLEALLPAETALVRDGDPDTYRRLVADTLVASSAPTGLPQLAASDNDDGTATMTEVRPALPSCSSRRTSLTPSPPTPADCRPGPAAPLLGSRQALPAREAGRTHRLCDPEEHPRSRLPPCASSLRPPRRRSLADSLSRSKRATPSGACSAQEAVSERPTSTSSPTRSSRRSSARSSGTFSPLGAFAFLSDSFLAYSSNVRTAAASAPTRSSSFSHHRPSPSSSPSSTPASSKSRAALSPSSSRTTRSASQPPRSSAKAGRRTSAPSASVGASARRPPRSTSPTSPTATATCARPTSSSSRRRRPRAPPQVLSPPRRAGRHRRRLARARSDPPSRRRYSAAPPSSTARRRRRPPRHSSSTLSCRRPSGCGRRSRSAALSAAAGPRGPSGRPSAGSSQPCASLSSAPLSLRRADSSHVQALGQRHRLLAPPHVPQPGRERQRRQAAVRPSAQACVPLPLALSPLGTPRLTRAALADILTRLSTLFSPAPPSTTRPLRAVAQAPARHLAKYIFPRQFGLHNVFTSEKARTSFEIMPDYLDREVEIKVRRSPLSPPRPCRLRTPPDAELALQKLGSMKTPERLKAVLPLLDKLATLSSRCNYRKLLDRRCPSKVRPRLHLWIESQLTLLCYSCPVRARPRHRATAASASCVPPPRLARPPTLVDSPLAPCRNSPSRRIPRSRAATSRSTSRTRRSSSRTARRRRRRRRATSQSSQSLRARSTRCVSIELSCAAARR